MPQYSHFRKTISKLCGGRETFTKNSEARGKKSMNLLVSGYWGAEGNKHPSKPPEFCPDSTRKWILDQLRGWHREGIGGSHLK